MILLYYYCYNVMLLILLTDAQMYVQKNRCYAPKKLLQLVIMSHDATRWYTHSQRAWLCAVSAATCV